MEKKQIPEQWVVDELVGLICKIKKIDDDTREKMTNVFQYEPEVIKELFKAKISFPTGSDQPGGRYKMKIDFPTGSDQPGGGYEVMIDFPTGSDQPGGGH